MQNIYILVLHFILNCPLFLLVYFFCLVTIIVKQMLTCFLRPRVIEPNVKIFVLKVTILILSIQIAIFEFSICVIRVKVHKILTFITYLILMIFLFQVSTNNCF